MHDVCLQPDGQLIVIGVIHLNDHVAQQISGQHRISASNPQRRGGLHATGFNDVAGYDLHSSSQVHAQLAMRPLVDDQQISADYMVL